MRGQAVFAAVELGNCERNALTQPGVERAFGQRAVERQVPFEGCRAVTDELHEVGHHAQLLMHGIEQRFGFGGDLFDGRDGDSGHDRFLWLGVFDSRHTPQRE